MSKPCVLLIVTPELYRQSLREVLEAELGLQIVGNACDLFEVSAELERTRASVVIHSSAGQDTLFSRFGWMNRQPDLRVISVSPGSVRLFRYGVVWQSLETDGLCSTIDALRHLLFLHQVFTEKQDVNLN